MLMQLMLNGKALSRDEIDGAPRLRGELVVETWTEGSVFRRPVLRARLTGTGHGEPPDLIAPMFEPTILRIGADRMAIRGVQLISLDGHSRQVIQEWLVRPVAIE